MMKKYSFQMTKEEVRELCLRAIWEWLRRQRSKWLLLSAVLALECIFVSWTMALTMVILLLLIFAVFTVWNNFVMIKRLCGKTRIMEVEAGILKPGIEGELYGEIPCSSITEIRMTRHLLMLGLHKASKVIAWYPIPLRVFADGQERDGFLESVRNPQVQAWEKTAVSDMGEHGETSVIDFGVQAAEKSEQEYFRLSFQVGEEEWARIMATAAEIIQAGTLGKQKNRLVWIILAAVFSVLLCGVTWFLPGATGIIQGASLTGTFFFLILLGSLVQNPERTIRAHIRKGTAQNDVLGLWEISVTEMGIRQCISGKNSAMIPWESLLCVVETDNELFFYQKDKRHYSALLKEGLESREQIENLKGLCREKHLEVLAGKRKKYVPKWLFTLLLAVVMVGYLVFGGS